MRGHPERTNSSYTVSVSPAGRIVWERNRTADRGEEEECTHFLRPRSAVAQPGATLTAHSLLPATPNTGKHRVHVHSIDRQRRVATLRPAAGCILVQVSRRPAYLRDLHSGDNTILHNSPASPTSVEFTSVDDVKPYIDPKQNSNCYLWVVRTRSHPNVAYKLVQSS